MYYFSELNIRGNHAGTKARNDTETILKRFGAIPINKKQFVLHSREDDSIYSNIKSKMDLIPYFLNASLVRNAYVFLQYPMLAFDWTEKYLDILSKHNKIVLLIHDLHSLRRGNLKACEEEISIINKADTVIVHNRFMKEKLVSLGMTVSNVYCLNIFDYLCEESVHDKNSETIVFAGNLTKSEFLYEMFTKNAGVVFNVYGNEDGKLSSYRNVNYCGSYLPDELPSVIEGKYGLVWDGNDVERCGGHLGEYTRINNPHKLSLYVASGIPAIVWKEAAVAEYVEENNIGILADHVTNLKELMDTYEKEYQEMKKNIMRIREDVVSGRNLLRILTQIEGAKR